MLFRSLGGSVHLLPEDDVAMTDDSKLTDEEVEEMPAELRDIYEMETDVEEQWRKKSRPKISDLWD